VVEKLHTGSNPGCSSVNASVHGPGKEQNGPWFRSQ